MNAIFLSDLHLTDSPRDAYRWLVFEWLVGMLTKHPEHFHYLFIAGDLTDRKDYHSSRLTNRIVEALWNTKRKGGLDGVIILRGNHDGLDPDCPFFKFLNHIPGLSFVLQPELRELEGMSVLLLPHSRQPEEEWKVLDLHAPDLILMHQTMEGAVAETGAALKGLQHDIFRQVRCSILSGDIHSPQKCGKVEYVGAPYHVRFGDVFDPRAVVYVNDRRQKDWVIPGPRKHVVVARSFEDLEVLGSVMEGDHVKVRLQLSRSEYVDFEKYKRKIEEVCFLHHLDLRGIELVKQEKPTLKGMQKKQVVVDPASTVRGFGKRHKLDEQTVETGVEMLP